MHSPPGNYDAEPTPRPHRRTLHPLVIAGIVLAVLLVVCGGGIVALGLLTAGQDKAPAAPVVGSPPGDTPSAGLSTAAPSLSPAVKAPPVATTKAAPPPPAKIVIDDGTWTIGEDFPPGKYVVTGAPSTCYWEITKAGTNGADIISNGLGPGNLRVTLKTGQEFSSDDCGTWVKQ